jgi:hypothetical protein
MSESLKFSESWCHKRAANERLSPTTKIRSSTLSRTRHKGTSPTTIVSLNNTAVSLLADHHCYQQAQLILKDAVSLLKHAVAMNASGSDPLPVEETPTSSLQDEPMDNPQDQATRNREKAHSSRDILRSLADARMRAHQLACHADPFPGPHLPFSVVCDDGDCHAEMLDFRSCIAFPIHIAYPDVLTSSGGSNDRFMAIVSYNYALTFLCNSRLAPTLSRAVKLQGVAAKILRVATNFIAGAVCGHQDDDYPERTLLVAVLTLHLLVSTLQQAPGHHHVETVRRMHSLRLANQQLQAVRLLQKACTSGSSFIAAPAA